MFGRLAMLLPLAVVLTVGCGPSTPTAANVVGTYSADLAPQTGPARRVTLRLADGNGAEMVTEFESGAPTVRETGTWAIDAEGDVRIVLARGGFGPVTNDVSFRYTRATLTAVAFDTAKWGSQGFALRRQ